MRRPGSWLSSIGATTGGRPSRVWRHCGGRAWSSRWPLRLASRTGPTPVATAAAAAAAARRSRGWPPGGPRRATMGSSSSCAWAVPSVQVRSASACRTLRSGVRDGAARARSAGPGAMRTSKWRHRTPWRRSSQPSVSGRSWTASRWPGKTMADAWLQSTASSSGQQHRAHHRPAPGPYRTRQQGHWHRSLRSPRWRGACPRMPFWAASLVAAGLPSLTL
mmetsp:Transcript_96111/g.271748  ORF Transcript_96111/g.271748 Transcript_96111/m.271748 type:complete len:220 (+) Transcript_96111:276-935(+)